MTPLVYHNANALPRVFTVARQQTVSGAGAALAASTAPGFDRRHVVVTEHAIPGLLTTPRRHGGGQRPLISYRAERVVAEATVHPPLLLVLTDVYYPGWTVTVDGHPAPIDRVDYLLRGVPLTAGTHRIVFSYEPASFTAGWIISALAVIAILSALVVGIIARRRRPGTVRAVARER